MRRHIAGDRRYGSSSHAHSARRPRVVIGFAFRRNALLVVLVAGLVTGIAAGFDLFQIVASIGKAFTANRSMAVGWLVLPLIGVLERAGLQERAQILVRSLRAVTAGRVLLVYPRTPPGRIGRRSHVARRPRSDGPSAHRADGRSVRRARARTPSPRGCASISARTRAAADNIGLFFGEDIFVAIGSILLMKGFLAQSGFDVEPLRLGRVGDPDRAPGVLDPRGAAPPSRPSAARGVARGHAAMIASRSSTRWRGPSSPPLRFSTGAIERIQNGAAAHSFGAPTPSR